MSAIRARLRRTPVGLLIVTAFFMMGWIGPWIAPYDPLAIDLLHEYEPPSRAHLLGTGDNGIDILSALLHGARLAAVVGLVVVAVSVAFGTAVGTWAGYYGRAVDHVVTGVADLVQAFPAIVLNIAVLALVAKPGGYERISECRWMRKDVGGMSAVNPGRERGVSLAVFSLFWLPSRAAACCGRYSPIYSQTNSTWTDVTTCFTGTACSFGPSS